MSFSEGYNAIARVYDKLNAEIDLLNALDKPRLPDRQQTRYSQALKQDSSPRTPKLRTIWDTSLLIHGNTL